MAFDPNEIMQFFEYDHLPPHLAAVSQIFAEVAEDLNETLPVSQERSVALRKLLESKDAAVRAAIIKHEKENPAGDDD